MKICACTKNVQEIESDLNTSVDKSSLTPFAVSAGTLAAVSRALQEVFGEQG